MCSHRELPYKGTLRTPLPQSERAQDRRIILPLYPQMTDAEQLRVVEAVRIACG
jgi:dTDP-4-amino-4,6-dideoxygalactose transaminase